MAVASSVARYSTFFKKNNVRRVLDYGAGTLRNSCFLAEKGFCVYAADVPEQVERICANPCKRCLAGILSIDDLKKGPLDVDLVVSTFVLNIIQEGEDKSVYLRNAALNLRQGGYLLVQAACRRDTACDAGCSIFRKCSRCSKTYTHDEIDGLVAPYGFRRLCHYYRNSAVAVIYRLDKPVLAA